jgi:hypothetical protein
MVHGASLEIASKKFRVSLIVMPGLSLVVIMGINWMKEWRVVINTGSRSVSLNDPQGEGTF